MEQIKSSRIKSAGKNIENIGYFLLISNILPLILFFHISNLNLSDLNNIKYYYLGYGLTYFIISIFILANFIYAGNNLSNCDIEVGETTEIVYRETKDNKTLKIISKNNNTIGAEVFIEDVFAPDGEYEYLNDNRRLIVKNGKIQQLIK